ncbi:MAG TPA: GerAB/ArcD/ProY family transporter [Symbiobacteriaceae bacterium]|nr:GerAB/ArcD/ProY family transporter [Symbiobacteriaceae bacterium]
MLAPVWAGETGAWLAALLAGMWASIAFWFVTIGLRKVPGASLVGMARAMLGRPGAVTTGLLVTIALVYHAAFVLRETAEMAVSSVYPLTPQTFAVVALLVAKMAGAYADLNGLVRLARLFLPVLIASILFIVVGVIGWGEFRNLLPVWGPGPVALLGRSVPLTAMFTPGLFVLMAAGRVQNGRGLWQSAAAVGLGAGIIYALGLAMVIMTYTYPLANSITFPLHEMARLILGGRYFQRVEGIWVLIWVLATITHGALLLHVAAAAMAEAFEMATHREVILPLVTIVLTVAYIPKDQAQTIIDHAAGVPLGLAAGFGWPLLLAMIAVWRGRGKQRES